MSAPGLPLPPLLAVDLEPLLEVLVVTVFVLIPIVRSILDDKDKKAKRAAGGGPKPPRGDRPPTWEELLAGEVVEPAEPLPPPPVVAVEEPASVEPPPPRRTREPARAGSRRRRAAAAPASPAPIEEPDLVRMERLRPPSLGSEAVLAATVPSERAADLVSVPSEIGDELGHVPSEGAEPLEPSSPQSAGLHRDPHSLLAALERRGGHPFRRAVVLAEVLGRPLGARDPASDPGAPLGW